MTWIAKAVVLAGVAGIAAPWVSMRRCGTLDRQALESMRAPVVPLPRRAPDDLPRRPPAAPPRRREERPGNVSAG